MKKRFIVLPAAIAIGIFPGLAGAADLWSEDLWTEPTYTEQWSEPGYTEQWTEPTYTEQWSEETTDEAPSPSAVPGEQPEQPSPPPPRQPEQPELPGQPGPTPSLPPSPPVQSIYVKLQLDGKAAVVQHESTTLDVPPTSINGRTMVPFRFLGEALQATVEWDAAEQKITMSSGSKTIILIVNQPTALVNGKEVQLDAPPVLSEGRALVPLRFVGESLDLPVTFIAASNTIEIGTPPVNVPDLLPAQNETDAQGKELEREPLTDFEQLYGTWHLWTPGGATNLYYTDSGDYATHIYDEGAEQGTVTINADGTYSMNHDVWGDAEGKWRLSYPAEINGERIQAIVLEDGADGYDWAVAPAESGKIRLLYSWGTWSDGSSSWSFDSELYKQ